jgi:predicted nucleic acid-binding Zn ribbon protein
VVERVGQHRHCRECDKAVSYKDEFCDETCQTAWKVKMAKKKKQLLYFYAIMVVIMVIAITLTFMG